eukprot:TRINITY_DN20069_c0_g1_i1.p1 TRINITY_DN20069_c0_g1~~TRINITY_DN20069_c0_g1_i1.p1  ORF type:complete len:405 (+),score=38.11 TRINITY_DN20069_c0_g1_i1:6-1220(+)
MGAVMESCALRQTNDRERLKIALEYCHREMYHALERRNCKDRHLIRLIMEEQALDIRGAQLEIKEYCKFIAILFHEHLRALRLGINPRVLVPPPKIYKIWILDSLRGSLYDYIQLANAKALITPTEIGPNSSHNSIDVTTLELEGRIADFMCAYSLSKHQRKIQFGHKGIEKWPHPFETLIEYLLGFIISKKKLPALRAFLSMIREEMDLSPLLTDNSKMIQTCLDLNDSIRDSFGVESLSKLITSKTEDLKSIPFSKEIDERDLVIKLYSSFLLPKFVIKVAHQMVLNYGFAKRLCIDLIRVFLLCHRFYPEHKRLVIPPAILQVWRLFRDLRFEYAAFSNELGCRDISIVPYYSQYEKEHSVSIEEGYKQTVEAFTQEFRTCLLYTSPSPRDRQKSRMPSSA